MRLPMRAGEQTQSVFARIKLGGKKMRTERSFKCHPAKLLYSNFQPL